MSLVRFAMVCDKCRERQEEYAGWLSCAECGDDVCEKCSAVYDPDPPGHAICNECHAQAAIDAEVDRLMGVAQANAMNALFDVLEKP